MSEIGPQSNRSRDPRDKILHSQPSEKDLGRLVGYRGIYLAAQATYDFGGGCRTECPWWKRPYLLKREQPAHPRTRYSEFTKVCLTLGNNLGLRHCWYLE